MAHLLANHRRKVSRLVAKVLTRIDHALDAHATDVVVGQQTRNTTEKGKTTDTRVYKSVLAGVDHYARMTAAKRLLEMIQAARGEDVQQRPTMTWETFLALKTEWETKTK
jgi:hypothetical protein